MDEALAAIAELPASEEDALASLILEEIASERRWSEAFGRSPDALAHLADEALVDMRSTWRLPSF
jgi:hypothetical protein